MHIAAAASPSKFSRPGFRTSSCLQPKRLEQEQEAGNVQAWGQRPTSAHPAPLHLLGGHDNDVAVLLVHHGPEVVHRCLQAALGGYIDLAVLRVPSIFRDALGTKGEEQKISQRCEELRIAAVQRSQCTLPRRVSGLADFPLFLRPLDTKCSHRQLQESPAKWSACPPGPSH